MFDNKGLLDAAGEDLVRREGIITGRVGHLMKELENVFGKQYVENLVVW